MAFQEVLCNVRQLSFNLRAEGVYVDALLSQMQVVHDEIAAMQPAQQPTGSHRNNASAQQLPDLRSATDLRKENQELRMIAAEQQLALELIMTKYRAKIVELKSEEGKNKKLIDLVGTIPKAVNVGEGPVGKMKSVIKKSIAADEEALLKEEELISSLRVENRGLREMLEISYAYGSLPASDADQAKK